MRSIRMVTSTSSSIARDVHNAIRYARDIGHSAVSLRGYLISSARGSSRYDAITIVASHIRISMSKIYGACTIMMNILEEEEYYRASYENMILKAARDIEDRQDIKINAETINMALTRCKKAIDHADVSNIARSVINSASLYTLLRDTENADIKSAINILVKIATDIHDLDTAITIATKSLEKASSIHNYPEYIQVVMDLLIDNGHQSMVDHVLGLPSGTNDFRPLGDIYKRASATAKMAIEGFMRYIRLNGLNMEGCDFSGINLSGLDLSGVKLTNAKFIDANLSKCHIDESDIIGVNFSNANLDNTHIFRCNITGSIFRKCALRRTSFRTCTILESDFSGSRMLNTSFSRVNVQSSSFDGVRGTLAVTGSIFNNCGFISADITESSIIGSTIKQCDFSSATLDRINSVNNVIIRNKHDHNTTSPMFLETPI